MRPEMPRQFLPAAGLALGALLLMGAGGDLQQCAALQDPAARLACYDQAQQQREAPPEAPVAPEAPAAAPAPAAPAPAAASERGIDGFGKPESAPDSMTARIAGPFKEWRKGTLIRLDNGQVWKCLDDKSAYYPKLPDDAEVEITRGMLGYKMEIKAIRRSVYVRRVS
jgi:hypothetical protein